MAAYSGVVGVQIFNIMDLNVMIGLIIGAIMPFVFSALTMQAVGRAAYAMVQEGAPAVPGNRGTLGRDGCCRLCARR